MQPFPKPSLGAEEAELHSLRHMFKELKSKTDLQDDVQKIVQATEVKVRKMDSKTHGQLVNQLNNMRKKLMEIDEQWETYRNQWASYLDKASQMWVSHVESFEDGETKFAERRRIALSNLQTTRAALHEAHLKTMELESGEKKEYDMENAKEALDESMKVDEEDLSDSRLGQIKDDLTGIVQKVKTTIEERISKRDRSRSRTRASAQEDDVEILEPVDKRPRDSPVP